MIRLHKFLCCLKLEIGGYLIGWINLFASLLAFHYTLVELGDKFFQLIFSLTGVIFYGVVSFSLLNGVKKRLHILVQPYKIFCILTFIVIFITTTAVVVKVSLYGWKIIEVYHILEVVLGTIINIYTLIVVDSLHKKFRDEKFHRGGFIRTI
ncbi:CLUMA_CG020428, isoform A [Clunio marinus]|uniref:CLUMA_CG020428, isoform A n=1 Tax=Clunio marinus TaxID=568069 RepID=A0A1J1J4X6_9DIPT|nr:CLUMA_CG020428, isoform A [Clunio marinus]